MTGRPALARGPGTPCVLPPCGPLSFQFSGLPPAYVQFSGDLIEHVSHRRAESSSDKESNEEF